MRLSLTNLVCLLFDPAIPTSSFNFILIIFFIVFILVSAEPISALDYSLARTLTIVIIRSLQLNSLFLIPLNPKTDAYGWAAGNGCLITTLVGNMVVKIISSEVKKWRKSRGNEKQLIDLEWPY